MKLNLHLCTLRLCEGVSNIFFLNTKKWFLYGHFFPSFFYYNKIYLNYFATNETSVYLFRLKVENLSSRVSWQDLKDLLRRGGDVTFAEAHTVSTLL